MHRIKGLKASTKAFCGVKDGLWSWMLSNDAETSKIRSIVEEGMTLSVCSGISILFWHDNWCEVGILKGIFP